VTADQLEVAGTLDVTPAEWSADVIPRWTTLGAWRRFSTKVVQTPACWFWVGAIADDGYGRFHADEGRIVRVSRYVLAACTGPLPHDLVAEHRVCDDPLCTRLSHLRASTQAENLQTARRRDRAGNGHRLGSLTSAAWQPGPARSATHYATPQALAGCTTSSDSTPRWPLVTRTSTRVGCSMTDRTLCTSLAPPHQRRGPHGATTGSHRSRDMSVVTAPRVRASPQVLAAAL